MDAARADETIALTPDSAFARMWRGFMTARIAIGFVLLAVLGVLQAMGGGVGEWLISLGAVYVMAAIAVRMATQPLPPGHAFDPQWVFTIGVDLVAFAALQFLQAAGFNYSPLFALPVLMGAVLGSNLLALGTAAGVTLLLLVDAWVLSLGAPAEMPSRFLQAGLTGTGFFALAFLVNQLARRVAREEQDARLARRAARMQAEVNELVIEALSDGVLVVGDDGRVFAANPAARALLGFAPAGADLSLGDASSWAPLLGMARRTFDLREAQAGEVAIESEDASARRMHVRTRLTGTGPAESVCVMFLQDMREMEARLRTEKLAAMGRMSAAVAHEIRNPLAAIAQANELLDEDLRDPAQRQLSAMVRNNTQRLAQIVEEILDVSRARQSGSQTPPSIALDTEVAAACNDWRLQTRSGSRVQMLLSAPDQKVRFEADHLRRVLVNLLDNALRYAGDKPDSIRVWTDSSHGASSLHVWSDGVPLEATVQRHLFEPFFSSESRSSGLGLFICRELCDRHGALMGYQRSAAGTASNAREGNEFVVRFMPADSHPAANPSLFDTMTP